MTDRIKYKQLTTENRQSQVTNPAITFDVNCKYIGWQTSVRRKNGEIKR